MTTKAPIFEAEHVLASQTLLGEGLLWDSKTGLLHFVDIDNARIHSYDPETKKYSVDAYPETEFLGTIALRKDQPGFVACFHHTLVLLPEATKPTSTDVPAAITTREALKTLSEPLQKDLYEYTRFNDGQADPQGRMFYGSMTKPKAQDGKMRGELWRYDLDGTETKLLDNIGTSNGIGWTADGKTMYYIDSKVGEVWKFAFDPSTGNISDRTVFCTTPPDMDDIPTTGVFDGLCTDGSGNVWVARWKDRRVIGYNKDGEIIAMIRTPKAKSPTIPCFGGKNLDTLYIITAHSSLAAEGDIQGEYPHSGDLFKLDFGPNSEIRKLLGEDWKGADKYRFGL